MTEEEENLNSKKPTLAFIVIIAGIILAVLFLEWVFNFFKARM